MILTDTHSHLYDNKFAEDCTAMIARAFEGNVQRIFIPNVDQYTVKDMIDIVAAYPQKCFPMMGLHPCHVKEDFKAELSVLKRIWMRADFVPSAKLGWILLGQDFC